MRKTAYQVGGSIMGALIASSGIGLDAYSIVAPFGVSWKWFELLGFFVFAGFLYWGWISTSYKLRKCQNRFPTIGVIPITDGKFARLKVTNKGQDMASFGTKIHDWQEIGTTMPPIPPSYSGKWTGDDSPVITLIPEEERELLVIANDAQTLDDNGKVDGELRKTLIYSQSTIYETKIRDKSILGFSIHIFANPKLKTEFKRTYMITVNDNGWDKFICLDDEGAK